MDIFYFTMGNLAEVGDTLPNIVLLKQQVNSHWIE